MPGGHLANAWRSRSKHILQWRYRNEVSVQSINSREFQDFGQATALIYQAVVGATYTMTSSQLNMHPCLNRRKVHLSNNMICRNKQTKKQFLFEKLGVRDQSNANGQAVPRSWYSDGERQLWWDQSRTRNNQIVPPSWAEGDASWDVGMPVTGVRYDNDDVSGHCLDFSWRNYFDKSSLK